MLIKNLKHLPTAQFTLSVYFVYEQESFLCFLIKREVSNLQLLKGRLFWWLTSLWIFSLTYLIGSGNTIKQMQIL